MSAMLDEYENEPVPGLPARLPEGEHIIWQGAPCWRSLARHAFHLAQVVAYFGLLLAWSTASAMMAGSTPWEITLATAKLLALGSGAVAMLALVAWMTARTTLYTITNRRVVMRFGIALPIVFNLPYKQIVAAGLKTHADGTGDIPLGLRKGERLAWLIMWPHVRPWRVARAEPMLRGVPDAARVGQILARAMAQANDQPVTAAHPAAVLAGSTGHSSAAAAA